MAISGGTFTEWLLSTVSDRITLCYAESASNKIT